MGINDLWSVLYPGFDERVTVPVFVSRFISQHGRAPRLAIDGFMFLFQSKHSNLTDWTDEAIIRNFMAKLMYLSSLNISYVVVLDGVEKPFKMRNITNSTGTEIDSLQPLGLTPAFEHETIHKLKLALSQALISFIQSPGEAEAECAMLQKTEIADYVLSNDVDTLVFGAVQVLRNFSRYQEDKPASAITTTKVKSEFYVTPVHMKKVTEKTGLDYTRLILIATLRGGDYSSGVEKIGITRSVKLALCGTTFASFYHRSPTKAEKGVARRSDPLPDFSKMLLDCFVDPTQMQNIRKREQREIKLQRLVQLLNTSIIDRSRDIFERKATLENLFIEESFTMMYLFPVVSSEKFQFKAGCFSFGEQSPQTLPPMSFDFNIKYLILKLLSFDLYAPMIRVSNSKVIDNEQFVMLKYDGDNLFREVYPGNDPSQEESDASKEQSVWLPVNLVSLVNPNLVADFLVKKATQLQQKKPSPKKKPSQKTTLDSLFMKKRQLVNLENDVLDKIELPKKEVPTSAQTPTLLPTPSLSKTSSKDIVTSTRTSLVSNSTLNLKQNPIPKAKPALTRKRSPKKPRKLLPGQSLLTSFFQNEAQPETVVNVISDPDVPLLNSGPENPFVTNDLFVSISDSSSDSDSDSNIKLPKLAPDFLYRLPPPQSRSKRPVSAGLAESSPTKRHLLELSPDNSPEKVMGHDLPSVEISPIKKRK